jgi:hypothetical protein
MKVYVLIGYSTFPNLYFVYKNHCLCHAFHLLSLHKTVFTLHPETSILKNVQQQGVVTRIYPFKCMFSSLLKIIPVCTVFLWECWLNKIQVNVSRTLFLLLKEVKVSNQWGSLIPIQTGGVWTDLTTSVFRSVVNIYLLL